MILSRAVADFLTTTELRGLALPTFKGPGGYFETRTRGDAAWGDLMFALFVPQGSRPMNRAFGSTLHRQLFEPFNAETDAPVIDLIVREAAEQFCPHIQIQEVRVLAADRPKQLKFVVSFSLKTDRTETQTREVLIEKTHISVGGPQ